MFYNFFCIKLPSSSSQQHFEQLKLRTLIYTFRAWAPNFYRHIQSEWQELKLWKCFTVYWAWAPGRISKIQSLCSAQLSKHLWRNVGSLSSEMIFLYPELQLPTFQSECRELKLWKCFTVYRAWAPGRISNIKSLSSAHLSKHLGKILISRLILMFSRLNFHG